MHNSSIVLRDSIKYCLIAFSLLTTSLVPQFVLAQALEEVLVTATRRGQTDIQTTPVSVSALTGESLDNLNMNDLGDMAIMVPNLVSGNAPMFDSFNPSLRGVAKSDIILYVESPVGVAIDDFVVPHVQTQALEPFDIESIEVLRGPQGTLFGKNTTAGLINVRTVQPKLNERSIEVKGKYGSFDTAEGRFALNYGMDTIAFRAAGIYQYSDGFYRNGKQSFSVNPFTGAPLEFSGDGRRIGGNNVFSGRFKALWEPNQDFKVTFTYEIIRDRSEANPAVNEAAPGTVFDQLGFSGVQRGDPLDQAGQSNRSGPTITDVDDNRVDVDGFYLNMEWEVGNFRLFSTTGYRDQESRLPGSQTGEGSTEFNGRFISTFDNVGRDDNRETFQQEIRINSEFNGPFNFVAGGFYQADDTEFCVANVFGFVDFFAPGNPNLANGALAAEGLPPMADGSYNGNPALMCSTHEGEAIAGFFDATYDVTDRLTIGGGFRNTYEKKKWAGRGSTFPQFLVASLEDFRSGAALPDEGLLDSLNGIIDAANFDRFPHGVTRRSQSWTEPSWRVTLGYQATDEVFLWATRSNSFKSGAFNDQTGASSAGVPRVLTTRQTNPIDPEFADNLEFGLKADLLDRRLRLSAVWFDVKYDDAQRQLNATFTGPAGQSLQETLFFNAAKLEVEGVEVEGSWLVFDGLSVSANFSWQDAKFEKFEADTDFDGVIDVDLSDRQVDRAPEWTATAAVNYNHEIGRWGSLNHNLIVAYEDDAIFTFSDLGRDFDGRVNNRTLLNWSSTWTDNSGKYSIRVIGKNLLDERYRTGSLSVANLWTSSSYGPSRWFGVEFGARLDF